MWVVGEPVQGTRKDGRVKVTVSKAYTPRRDPSITLWNLGEAAAAIRFEERETQR